VLRKVLWQKREEVTGDWRKLHSEELHDLYLSSNILVIKSRQKRLVGNVAHLQEKRKASRSLVRKPGGKEALVRPRHRWEDSIKKDMRGREWEGVEWINLAPNMNKGWVL
jgi:hypothetical protein